MYEYVPAGSPAGRAFRMEKEGNRGMSVCIACRNWKASVIIKLYQREEEGYVNVKRKLKNVAQAKWNVAGDTRTALRRSASDYLQMGKRGFT